jgi:hypothetical protein
MPLLRTLPPFLLGRWRLGFEPGFDGGILREEVGHVRDEILDDREVWQWIDPYRPFNIADRLSACDRVGAVDIHRAAAADPLATRSSEHEGGIDPVLDEKKSSQDHGAAFVEIDVIGVDPGTLVPIGIEPIYLERFGAPCAFGRRPNLACTNLGVSRQPQHSAEELSCPRPRLAVFHTLPVNWPNSCMTPQSTPISSRQSRGDGLHATVAGPTIRPCHRFPTRESISGYDLISC